MESYCSKCGHPITNNLYCEECGEQSSNLPSRFSTEESLAGLIVSTIRQHGSITYSEILKLEKNQEKIYRTFSQLELTGNYNIVNIEGNISITQSSEKKTLSKNATILQNVNEIFKLKKEDIDSLF